MSCTPIEFLVPDGIDDPTRPSGGNRYDRRMIESLTQAGREVREHRVGDPTELAERLAGVPDGATVLVDGLLCPPAADVLVAAAERLNLVILLHMPFAEASVEEAVRRAERDVLTAAAGVVTTSVWARSWVVAHHGLAPPRVRVVTPGVDPAPVTWAFPPGGRLLCLAAVRRAKGHDTLLAALARIRTADWHLTCVGSLDLEPDFVAFLTELAERSGIADRITMAGPATGADLDFVLASADLVVSASRRESYGMAVTEALARAVPVVVTDVGGHPEAVGPPAAGAAAGVLVPPDDPDRLAAALRRWLTDGDERARLRAGARHRRTALRTWADAAHRLAQAVDAAARDRDARRPVPTGRRSDR